MAVCQYSCGLAMVFVSVTIRAVNERDAPAFGKTWYLWHNILNTCCQHQSQAFVLVPRSGCSRKQVFIVYAVNGHVFAKSNGRVGEYLLQCYGRQRCRCTPVTGQEVMRVWRLTVTGHTTVDDQYFAQCPAQGHCGRQAGIAAADNDCIIKYCC
ncbi:hypothetical protein D3C86_1489560 [compost metagenome]